MKEIDLEVEIDKDSYLKILLDKIKKYVRIIIMVVLELKDYHIHFLLMI